VLGITFLSAALSNYFLVQMRTWERWVCGGAAFLMVAPGLVSTLIGLAMVTPVLLRHIASMKRGVVAAA
jgi:TRAP-type uncharacterized transport system fused permease subunit